MTTPTMTETPLGGGLKNVTATVEVRFGTTTETIVAATIVPDDVHLMPVAEASGAGVTLMLVGNPQRGRVYAHSFRLDPTQVPPYEADAQEADDDGEQPEWWDE